MWACKFSSCLKNKVVIPHKYYVSRGNTFYNWMRNTSFLNLRMPNIVLKVVSKPAWWLFLNRLCSSSFSPPRTFFIVTYQQTPRINKFFFFLFSSLPASEMKNNFQAKKRKTDSVEITHESEHQTSPNSEPLFCRGGSTSVSHPTGFQVESVFDKWSDAFTSALRVLS